MTFYASVIMDFSINHIIFFGTIVEDFQIRCRCKQDKNEGPVTVTVAVVADIVVFCAIVITPVDESIVTLASGTDSPGHSLKLRNIRGMTRPFSELQN